MIRDIEPAWIQFRETYAAVREALGEISDQHLQWAPTASAPTPARIVRHITRANFVYSDQIERTETDRGPTHDSLCREELLDLLERSERRVREVFEAIAEDDARAPRAADWAPLGPLVDGPLDAIWFAHQIVRHSAYHLGQLSYIAQIVPAPSTS